MAKNWAAVKDGPKAVPERFGQAGKLPVGILIAVGAVAFVLGLAVGGFVAYEYLVLPQSPEDRP